MMTGSIAPTRENILTTAKTLPAAPQILAGLCELLQEVNTGLDEIATQIRLDPALAARVIRISNSVVFGGGGRIGSVDEAVNRVGFGELLRLVGAATAANLVDRALGSYGIPAEKLRENLLLHALAAEAVGMYAEVDVRTAYAGGLLRGIGMMVLDRAVRGKVAPADVYDVQRHPTYVEWEGSRFGIANTEVATMVLDEWRFPAELVTAVQEHLLLDERGYADRLAAVLNVSGAIVAETGLALPGDHACWRLSPEKLAAAGLDEGAYRTASEQARTRFEHQRAALY
jgi:HD-like signal output (HDOD) protein